jgi:hypothetical protein
MSRNLFWPVPILSKGKTDKSERPALGPPQTQARVVMDIYDDEDWTEMDIEDLKAAIEGGASIEQAADLLCRADGVDEVARKCAELGLKPKAGAH